MGTTNQVKIVLLQEIRDNVGAKRIAHTTVILSPTNDVLIRVRPQQVAKQPLVGDVTGPLDLSQLLNIDKVGGPL